MTTLTIVKPTLSIQNANVKGVMATLQLWHDRHIQRKQLASLSNELLKDIGINRSDVIAEINKPFWK